MNGLRREATRFEDGEGRLWKVRFECYLFLSSSGKESSRFRRRSARLGLLSEISIDEDIEEANNQGRCEDENRATQMDDLSHDMCMELAPLEKGLAVIGEAGCLWVRTLEG